MHQNTPNYNCNINFGKPGSGLQRARNVEKVKIRNQRRSYFFWQLDTMLFGVFGPKLIK